MAKKKEKEVDDKTKNDKYSTWLTRKYISYS